LNGQSVDCVILVPIVAVVTVVLDLPTPEGSNHGGIEARISRV